MHSGKHIQHLHPFSRLDRVDPNTKASKIAELIHRCCPFSCRAAKKSTIPYTPQKQQGRQHPTYLGYTRWVSTPDRPCLWEDKNLRREQNPFQPRRKECLIIVDHTFAIDADMENAIRMRLVVLESDGLRNICPTAFGKIEGTSTQRSIESRKLVSIWWSPL